MMKTIGLVGHETLLQNQWNFQDSAKVLLIFIITSFFSNHIFISVADLLLNILSDGSPYLYKIGFLCY